MAKNRLIDTGIYVTEEVNDPAQDGPHRQATPFEIGAILDRAEQEAGEVLRDHPEKSPIARDAQKLMGYVERVRRCVRVLPRIAERHQRYHRDMLAAAFHVGLLSERLLVRPREPRVLANRRNSRGGKKAMLKRWGDTKDLSTRIGRRYEQERKRLPDTLDKDIISDLCIEFGLKERALRTRLARYRAEKKSTAHKG